MPGQWEPFNVTWQPWFGESSRHFAIRKAIRKVRACRIGWCVCCPSPAIGMDSNRRRRHSNRRRRFEIEPDLELNPI